MDSNEIARNFYQQRPCEARMITAKQASWLYNVACREAGRKLTTHGTPTCNGMFKTEDDKTWSWELRVTPSGSGAFSIKSVDAIVAEQETKRNEMEIYGKQLARTYFELFNYDLNTLCRMFHATEQQVQQWIREGE